MSSKAAQSTADLLVALQSEIARLESELETASHAVAVANKSYDVARSTALDLAVASITPQERESARRDPSFGPQAGIDGLLRDKRADAIAGFTRKYPPPPRPLTEAVFAQAKAREGFHALRGALATIQKSLAAYESAAKAYAPHAGAVDQLAIEAQQELDRRKLEDEARRKADEEVIKVRMRKLGVLQ
jgi:hypothetical protein